MGETPGRITLSSAQCRDRSGIRSMRMRVVNVMNLPAQGLNPAKSPKKCRIWNTRASLPRCNALRGGSIIPHSSHRVLGRGPAYGPSRRSIPAGPRRSASITAATGLRRRFPVHAQRTDWSIEPSIRWRSIAASAARDHACHERATRACRRSRSRAASRLPSDAL